ncbi:hypothetical protein EYS14_13325 [Alteromonadaceae bacterium M269]|nr:hypothetical protein EYS14_13325 [Alteromonadaceae bacterium M269]
MASPVENLNIIGQAKLKVLFWDIYESYLYTDKQEYRPDVYPVALRIRYLRDISKDDLLERTDKEWKDLGLSKEQRQQGLALVENVWPDISKGDELLIKVDENQESTFYFNQKSIAHIKDKSFGPQFLDIWLSENCSRPELRNQLIGKS